MKTPTPLTAGLAALAVVGAAVIFHARTAPPVHDDKLAGAARAVPVRLATVASGDEIQYLDATGAVHAQLEANIATKVQGRVLAVYVREGDRVRRGQPLIRLDARDLDAAVAQATAGVHVASVGLENARMAATMEQSMSDARIAQAEAAVANAQAAAQAVRARLQLVQSGPRLQEKVQAGLAVAQAQSSFHLAEANLKRYQSLYNQGAVARQQLDIQQSQYDVAKAQYDSAVQGQSIAEEGSRQEDIQQAQDGVRQADAALNQARAGLKQAKAAAMQANVRRAEVRGAAAQVGQGRAALQMAAVTRDYATIAAPFDGVVSRRMADPGSLASPGVPLLTVQGGSLQLQAVIPESSLANVRQGARLPVRLDALPGRVLYGRVAEIAPQGDVQSHTFLVKVSLPDGGVRSGMFGRVKLASGRARQTTVPASAVVRREGLSYVFIADAGGRARLRLITAGDAEGGRVPTLSGLVGGERVIVDSATVSDGVAVTEGR
ncbi:MAG TPA: efflux RND transporter periplasmic adaptor subunit [Armatimonadota bacterium]|jgi:RND family efflux transporter MFP subunit